MNEAAMPLHSWVSNSVNFNETLEKKGELKDKYLVLGVEWNRKQDTISINLPMNWHERVNGSSLTRRELLSIVASIYDPLGLVSPVTVDLRKLLQEAWRAKTSWDGQLPEILHARFTNLLQLLPDAFQLKVPRAIFRKGYHLHVFSDASSQAYGTVAYTVDYQLSNSNLLSSKVKVAPIKSKLTIPKLELAALTLSARLANNLVKLHEFRSVTLWCDSMVCIAWTKRPNASKDVFVANRANEITNTQFPIKYVPTKDNPADMLSRGMSLSNSQNATRWLQGPEWLGDPERFPEEAEDINVSLCTSLESRPHPEAENNNLPSSQVPLFNLYYTNNLQFIINVVRTVVRFILRASLNRIQINVNPLNFLVAQEQSLYLSNLISHLRDGAPLDPTFQHLKVSCHLTYVEEQGLVVARTRILDGETPRDLIYIPNESRLAVLIMTHLHNEHHHCPHPTLLSLYRSHYHTIKARVVSKSIVRGCRICRRDRGHLPAAPPYCHSPPVASRSGPPSRS